MERGWLGVLVALSIVVAGGAARAQDAAVQILAATCATCHGPDYRGATPMPNLSIYRGAEIQQILIEFKTGARPGTVMPRLTKGYGDDQIAAVAQAVGATLAKK